MKTAVHSYITMLWQHHSKNSFMFFYRRRNVMPSSLHQTRTVIQISQLLEVLCTLLYGLKNDKGNIKWLCYWPISRDIPKSELGKNSWHLFLVTSTKGLKSVTSSYSFCGLYSTTETEKQLCMTKYNKHFFLLNGSKRVFMN